MNSPTITIRVEPELIKIIDKLVKEGIGKSRSDILRKALLHYLSEYVVLDAKHLYLTIEA